MWGEEVERKNCISECPFSERDNANSERPGAEECVGEIGCVIQSWSKKDMKIRVKGFEWNAKSLLPARRGEWVRVIGCNGTHLKVIPLNIWLGSCCC